MVHDHRFTARKKEWLRQYKEEQMKKLDAQGRHRSEWCYAAYDGRKEEGGIPIDLDKKWQHPKNIESIFKGYPFA